MLWIFKFARWTPDRCTKKERKAWLLAMASELHPLRFEQHRSFVLWDLNSKFGSVAYRGHPNKLTELHWSFNRGHFCKVGTPKPDIQMQIFLTWDLFIFMWKKIKTCCCICYTRTLCSQLEKIRSEPKLLLGVYYWFLKLYTRIIWHSYFPSHGIS